MGKRQAGDNSVAESLNCDNFHMMCNVHKSMRSLIF